MCFILFSPNNFSNFRAKRIIKSDSLCFRIMKNFSALKFFVPAVLIASATVGGVYAQPEPEPVKKVNFGYSRNPKTKSKSATAENTVKTQVPPTSEAAVSETVSKPVNTAEKPIVEGKEFESRSIANKTLEVVKRATVNAVSPTEIYKVAAGDVLFISLQNVPTKASAYFTVLNDGTIDYPLAGEMIQVGGLTTEEIEDSIKEKIKLYENPQISVKVREHASHVVTVLGMVEKAGELYLKREAMPLFIIRAEAIVQARADSVTIKRANAETEQIDLKDAKSDDVLIFPGDILEFKSVGSFENNSASRQFYFIGGNIASAGQKDYTPGLSLTQAILASGGLKKATVKKVVVRRKNQAGLLSSLEYDLNSIKNGKQPDPQINAGDTIEIVN